VVTLASNLENKNKGGQAKSIVTSFFKENVKWENIYIQGEEKPKGKNDKLEEKVQNESLINLSSKLAVILYKTNSSDEWIGVEGGKKEDFELKDIFAVFSLKEGDNNIISNNEGEEKVNQSKFREIFVTNMNSFLEASKKKEEKEIELIKQSPGSPLYYRDFYNGAYVIAIINESFEFQYFDKETIIFLANIINKGKLLRKKKNNKIDEENIVRIDLQRHDFGPLDMKYLIQFNLKNLRILDLSSNSIRSEGVFYLSHGRFNSLENLNLNFNEIGDEGLFHLMNGYFSKLNVLYLYHDNISSEGIKYLAKSSFINNLLLLSLSENPKIGDTGVRYMKEHNKWENLAILNLNYAGLTDISLEYIIQSSMTKLKKLNIQGNKFTDQGKTFINNLRMNHIHVSYKTEAERKKEKEKKQKIMQNNSK